MNSILRKMVVVVLIIVFAVVLTTSYAIHRSRQLELREQAREQLQAEIINLIVQYRNGETQTIDLSKITSITWDRFYAFGPYIPRENIEKRLGAPFRPDRRMAPPRQFDYLIFTLDGEVVQYVEWSDHIAYFSGSDDRQEGYSPDEALFVINEYGYVMWVYDIRLQTK